MYDSLRREGIQFMFESLSFRGPVQQSEAPTDGASGLGCVLAHSMGLGKTLQVVALLHALTRAKHVRRCIVVVPVSLQRPWLETVLSRFLEF